jgi:hypothetical protein
MQATMSYQDRHTKRLEQERKVTIYYIPVNMLDGRSEYLFVASSALLHEQFMAALEFNQIPDFAVIVAHGEGEPNEDVKLKLKHYYGYDHDKSYPLLSPNKADETGTLH